MRKSSVHFKQVANASVSIAHSTRTEETEPAYLLPKEHRLGNVIVPGSMSNIELGLEFTRAKASMTGQAKARGSSPFWEGVVVLDGTDMKSQTAALQIWKKEYEKATGQRVLHMAIHGDEGFINSEGKPEYNIHAHVIVNRLNDKGRVIKLERKQLSEVQDLTAKSLGMQRGETLEDRKGMRGRKHMNHREFRKSENEKRLDVEAVQVVANKVPELEATVTSQAEQIAMLKAQIEADYKAHRAAMVASKTATQAEYKALKEAKDKELADLKAEALGVIRPLRAELNETKEKVEKMDEYTKTLNAELAQKDAQIASELVAKAQVIEALVKSGEKSEALLVTSEGHREAADKLLVRHEAFKVKAQAKIDEIIGGLTAENTQLATDLAAANKLVEGFKQARIAKPNLPAPKEVLKAVDTILVEQARQRIKTPVEAPKAITHPIAPPTLTKSPREAFLALYEGVKVVLAGMIDGFRLDAAEGRLGLFSAHRHGLGRVEVLCEVPEDKVMPQVGQVFDSRAVPEVGQVHRPRGSTPGR